jgi:hypothetical protein
MSDLREKHRTHCKEIMHLGFQIVEHAQYLKRYPESNGDSLSIGKCIYDITQKLVTLTKIKESLIGD